MNLDVVQLIVLEVYHQPMGAPLVSYPIASNFGWSQIAELNFCSYLWLIQGVVLKNIYSITIYMMHCTEEQLQCYGQYHHHMLDS